MAVQNGIGGGVHGRVDLELTQSQVTAPPVGGGLKLLGHDLDEACFIAVQSHLKALGRGHGVGYGGGGGVRLAVQGDQHLKGLGEARLLPCQGVELDALHRKGAGQVDESVELMGGVGGLIPLGGKARGLVAVVGVDIGISTIALTVGGHEEAFAGHVARGDRRRLKCHGIKSGPVFGFRLGLGFGFDFSLGGLLRRLGLIRGGGSLLGGGFGDLRGHVRRGVGVGLIPRTSGQAHKGQAEEQTKQIFLHLIFSFRKELFFIIPHFQSFVNCTHLQIPPPVLCSL